MEKKIHIIGGILTSACGKQLEEITWVGNEPKKVTCKICLRIISNPKTEHPYRLNQTNS